MIAGLKPYPAMKDSGVEWLSLPVPDLAVILANHGMTIHNYKDD